MAVAAPLIVVLALLAAGVLARDRSAAEVAAFKRETPCPSTGERRGSCPGYVVDHITPLCAGGPDTRSNMQWQTTADALVKDWEERRMCRSNQASAPRKEQ